MCGQLNFGFEIVSKSNERAISVCVSKFAERRIVGLKKRVEELRSEAEVANAELEDAKRSKEIAEQELKGYEVELALSETSIQSLKVNSNRSKKL